MVEEAKDEEEVLQDEKRGGADASSRLVVHFAQLNRAGRRSSS